MSFLISVKEKEKISSKSIGYGKKWKFSLTYCPVSWDIEKGLESKMNLRAEKLTALFMKWSALVLKRHIAKTVYICTVTTANSCGLWLCLPKQLSVHLKGLSARLLLEGYAVHTLNSNLHFKKNKAIFLFSFYLTLRSPPMATAFFHRRPSPGGL